MRSSEDGGAEYKYDWKGFGEYVSVDIAKQNGTERLFRPAPSTSQTASQASIFTLHAYGRKFTPGNRGWSTSEGGMYRALKADRLLPRDKSISYVRFYDDQLAIPVANLWLDTRWGFDASEKRYVVETNPKVIQRCILMASDPGDLVLDPTCGSGTTAAVAEQWGRRWITIDTSRVALALARVRIMGARYSYYFLADSREGQEKEAEVSRTVSSSQPVHGNIRLGFVYERVPHITLKSIANNAEIDVIWDKWEKSLAPLREELGAKSGEWKDKNGKLRTPEEWEIPREPATNSKLTTSHLELVTAFWDARIARQKEIDASIAAKAEFEYLYDKPYEDKKKVRVAGPFTVESLSPHRMLGVDENDDLIDPLMVSENRREMQSFPQMILDNLKTAGVQQAHKTDKIDFVSLTPWPGDLVCAEGRYMEGIAEKRAAIFIGPEFGTVQRADLVTAAREAADASFDVLIACAFNYEAHTTEFNKLGKLPVLKARMNADLHMADDLKNTGKGNLFVIFGEPDIEVVSEEWLVDSLSGRIAPYEIFKFVSGIDSLTEINRLKRDDFQSHANISCRREVWDHLADAASEFLHSGQHRRGAGKKDDGGVSSVAWHCSGVAGGVGNVLDCLRKAGIPKSAGFRDLIKSLHGDQQNAERPHKITSQLPLTTHLYSQITIHGVDVFHPSTGEVRSNGADGIACWFIDTDYNEESFFVRHAYFLGANDPYSSLKTTLKAEIDPDAWATLNSDTSRPFPKPRSGRIAVKVINHLGDEVMKVFRV